MNIYIGEATTIIVSDMQGPAPDGFHVPLSSEWQSIYNAGTSLGAWTSSGGQNFSTYLKLPMAGCRSYDKTVYDLNSFGRYWSSTPNSSDSNNANELYFYSSDIRPQYDDGRSYGLYVRCIKNSPTIPTSSWTQLYGTNTGRGIFWNSTEGLISISSNGTTRYTIMDKNLGATTVYNYGDNLTNANCGNVFQRGNNHGFPGTLSSDSITTSTTQVDASSYGPGNYYSSSTWINYRPTWSNPANNNLRGGVSQGTSTKTVAQELQNIYIGEYNPYQGEMIAYKMNADSSGNLYVPLSGLNHSGYYGPSYSWKVSVDGGSETTYSGTGSNGGFITLSGYTANTEHLIKITPVTEGYGWALAYGWGGNSKRFSLTEVVYDSSYMGYATSATYTDDYFRYGQYRNCNITSAPYEYLPDTVTQIGAYYRAEQYRECTKLTSAPEESLPNSVTYIGNYFRQYQYYSCNSIAEIKGWKDLSIGSTGYRNSQYYIQPNTGATVKVLSDVGYAAGNTYSLLNAYTASVYVPSAYLNNFKNASIRPWSDIDDSKFIGY